jgi:simple sugar transport system ATP-binding protein
MLLSGDLDELIAMSDRIIVIYRGRTSNAIARKDFDKLKIGELMLGREFQISQGL